MARKTASRSMMMLRSAGLPAFAIIFMGFFAYYAVMGPNGVLSYRDYQRQIAVRQTEFARLDKVRSELKNRVNLLDSRHADPDMVDETVRRELNVVHPNEHVFMLPQQAPAAR